MKALRTVVWVLLIGTTALALAAAARYGLVEPADMTARCDGGAQEVWCSVRAWTIQVFVNQRIGWAALALATIATLTGWRSVAGTALFTACISLILYTTELGAPAALMALLVFVRDGQTAAPANTHSSAPYHNA